MLVFTKPADSRISSESNAVYAKGFTLMHIPSSTRNLIKSFFIALLFNLLSSANSYGAEFVLQPGPGDGKDIWTTNVYSYAPGGGGPGGGLNDQWLRVGGWGDLYYSLIQFDLSGLPQQATSATVSFYMPSAAGYGSTGLYLDRITQFWDWRTQGTGTDRDRLWWADRPSAVQWLPQALPAPAAGQWYSIDITSLYNAWKNGTYPNYGIQLRPVSNNNQWAQFYSADYLGDPSLRPKLVTTQSSSSIPCTTSGQLSAPTPSVTVTGNTIDLSWNAVSGATGYQVYYGLASGAQNYSSRVDLGTTLFARFTDIPQGTYYGVISAYRDNAAGHTEGDCSTERTVIVSASTPPPTAPTITSTPPPSGTVGTAYSFTYTATGSTPITYSVTSGALPNGLSLSASGVISGTPTLAGTYTGTVTASNGTLPNATQNFSITVTSSTPPPPTANNTSPLVNVVNIGSSGNTVINSAT